MAGYSRKTLRDKLGLKENSSALFVNTPKEYFDYLGDVSDVSFGHAKDLDFVHLFVKSKKELENEFLKISKQIKPAGIIWISWPKGSQKVITTDLNENVVRDLGLNLGLVDVKVAAIDDVWSGLKFVIRVKNR